MTNPDEFAFPHKNAFMHPNGQKVELELTGGLTKREYFAAMAFSGMEIGDSPAEKTAQWAVEYADALISELNKETK